MRSMPPRLITYAILQDAHDANVIYLGTNLGVYHSLDRGASWAPVWAVTKPTAITTKGRPGKKKTPTSQAPEKPRQPNPPTPFSWPSKR